MDSLPQPDASNTLTGARGVADCDPDVARYVLLANRICGTLAQGSSLVLAVGEPSVDALSLRTAIEPILEPVQVQVLELACGHAHSCGEIVKDLARFIARGARRRPAGNGGLDPTRTLIICDEADRLEDDQLHAIHLFLRDRPGEVAAVLLVSPDFLIRVQHPGLEPVRDAASLCVQSEELGQPGDIDEPGGQAAAAALHSPAAGRIVFEGSANADVDAANAARGLSDESDPSRLSDLELDGDVLSPASPRDIIRRHPRLTLVFGLAYVLCEFGILYMGWEFSAELGNPARAAPIAAVAPLGPDARSDLRIAERSLALAASATNSVGAGSAITQRAVANISQDHTAGDHGAADRAPADQVASDHLAADQAPADHAPADHVAAEPSQIAPRPEPSIVVAGQAPTPGPQPPVQEDKSVDSHASVSATVADAAAARAAATDQANGPVAASPPAVAANVPTAISPPATAPAKSPAKSMLPPEDVAALLARGEVFFASGDIASARLFFERAANEGNPQAAFRMGETFDPAYLGKAGVRGVPADASRAAFWYGRAQDLAGVTAAPASTVTGP